MEHIVNAGYTLLTGATGLVGRYLLRDFSQAGVPLCVLARSSRRDSAADRIETVMAWAEQNLGRSLPRPVVLEGSLDEPSLGLSSADRQWVRKHCARVLHSAASLKFEEDADGEPERTNLHGTRHVLELAREAGIVDFHYVSTAYVAGLRTGRVRETELAEGQAFGNPYEQSKHAAEQLVRAQTWLARPTIYRPSIIVGDSQTGYTSTFHGFYTPLRVGHALAPKAARSSLQTVDVLAILGLKGHERKNLVPVDWVSAAIVRLVAKESARGRTYHLSNPRPITVRQMQEAFLNVLEPFLSRESAPASPIAGGGKFAFDEQMQVYRSYWRDDADFDRSQIDAALPELPCPELTPDRLMLLAQFAIDKNFGWPCEKSKKADTAAAARCTTLVGQALPMVAPNAANCTVGMQVTGHGGGDWELKIDRAAVVDCGQGLPADADVMLYLTGSTLRDLAERRLNPDDALSQGKVLALGRAAERTLCEALLAAVRRSSATGAALSA